MGSRALGRDRRTRVAPDSSQTEPPSEATHAVERGGEPGRTTEDRARDTRAVIVLGGGSDIGIAIAAELVARGAETVVLAGRNLDRMREQALEAGIGVRVETVPFDARYPESHVSAVEEAFTLAGEVQAVVVAFGILGVTASYEANPALAGDAALTNFAGAISSSLAATRALARQQQTPHGSGDGTLVVLSSIASVRPRRRNYVYGSTKAGLDFFARGLADSVRDRGVRVLVVRPGFVDTKMTRGLPHRLFGITADRVARDVAEAIEGDAVVAWSPGILRWTSIPLRLAPGFIVRRI